MMRLELVKGRKEEKTGIFAEVDEKFWPVVSAYTWHPMSWRRKKNGRYVGEKLGTYPRAQVDGKQMYMHVLIGKHFYGGIELHHKDNDGLNNTEPNLDPCPDSRQDNQLGKVTKRLNCSSSFRGVSQLKKSGKWRANFKSKKYGLKFSKDFETEMEAVYARDEFVRKHCPGAFLNLPDGPVAFPAPLPEAA
jgi:hypothetical protein